MNQPHLTGQSLYSSRSSPNLLRMSLALAKLPPHLAGLALHLAEFLPSQPYSTKSPLDQLHYVSAPSVWPRPMNPLFIGLRLVKAPPSWPCLVKPPLVERKDGGYQSSTLFPALRSHQCSSRETHGETLRRRFH
jgi:hypothetical protein